MDHCLLVGRTDFLFGCLYEYFSADSVAKATYLECLEPYILNDTLTSVTPGVMKDFVEHYESRGSLAAVEACITHMDIASLDIHQVPYIVTVVAFLMLNQTSGWLRRLCPLPYMDPNYATGSTTNELTALEQLLWFDFRR